MCKHILNAQVFIVYFIILFFLYNLLYLINEYIIYLQHTVKVSIRAPCCQRWFDCPDCHAEVSDHQIKRALEMVFACKKCKKVFRKDMRDYDETDEYCPHCDNHYVLVAKTPSFGIGVEGEDPRKDNR